MPLYKMSLLSYFVFYPLYRDCALKLMNIISSFTVDIVFPSHSSLKNLCTSRSLVNINEITSRFERNGDTTTISSVYRIMVNEYVTSSVHEFLQNVVCSTAGCVVLTN